MISSYCEKMNYNFIKIKKSSLQMGPIPNDKYVVPEIEKNRNIILTKDFYIQDAPVTAKQYWDFVRDTGYNTEYQLEIWDGEDWKDGPYFNDINGRGDNYPVVGVSYIDALKFIEWLSTKTKINFRLPTEAEFEYSAKGGCLCTGQCKCANIAKNKNLCREENELPLLYPREIKKGICNDWGLYDMHALLWQWCSDWFYFYEQEDRIDPKGPKTCPDFAPWKGEKWSPGKVIRGGSFSYPFFHSRCSNRHYSKITDRNFNLGFRLVFDGE